MSDTLITAVPPTTGEPDDTPTDSTATRHLCAGVYVDRSFRDLVIKRIHNDARHRLAPSYGFDLVPVVRHAWWSWWLETAQLLAMLGILVAGLVTGGPLVVVTVCCAVLVWRLLRGVVRELPDMVRHQWRALSDRWGLHAKNRQRRDHSPDLRNRKRRIKAMLAGVVVVLAAPLILAFVLDEPIVSAIGPALVLAAALVVCAVVAGVARQRRLHTVAHARTSRPRKLTRREKTVDEQQNHPCVIYHRPPHRDDDMDPLDLLTRTDTPSPFVGSGRLVYRWPALTIQLLRPGKGSLQEREYTTAPFTAHKLVEALRSALTALTSDRDAESLPDLRVRDRVYIAAADFPADSPLIRGPLGKFDLWGIVNDHRLPSHHFLETSVPISGGELVATILIRVSLKGRTLSLDVATCALTRTPENFHVIDRFGEHGVKGMVRSVIRFVLALPVDVMRIWRVFAAPTTLAVAWWAQRDRTITPRRRTVRPISAVREEIANNWENARLDRTTIKDHMKIVEQRILKATEDFLREHEVDTSKFENQATNIINSSGVVNMDNAQMTVQQFVNNLNQNGEAEGTGA